MKISNKVTLVILITILGLFYPCQILAKEYKTSIEKKVYAHIVDMLGSNNDEQANNYYQIILDKIEFGEDFSDWPSADYFLKNSSLFYDNPNNQTKRALDQRYQNLSSKTNQSSLSEESKIKNRIQKLIATMPGNNHDDQTNAYYETILDKKERQEAFNDLEAADYFLQNSIFFYFNPNDPVKLTLDKRYERLSSGNSSSQPVLSEIQTRVVKRIQTMVGNTNDERANTYYSIILNKIESRDTFFEDREAADYFLQNSAFFYYNPNNYQKLALDTRYNNLRRADNIPSQSQGKFKDILVVRQGSNDLKEIVGYAQNFDGIYYLNGSPIEGTYNHITYDFSDNYKNIAGLAYYSDQTQPIIIVDYQSDIEKTINGYIRYWGCPTNYYLALWNRTYLTGNDENGSQIFDLDAKDYFINNLSKWRIYLNNGHPIGRVAYVYPNGVTGYITGEILDQSPTKSSFGLDYYREVEYQNSYHQHSHGYITLDQIRVHVASLDNQREGEITAKDLFNYNNRITDLTEITFVNSAGGKSTAWVKTSSINWFN